jgi:hypothetical protein
MIYKLFTKKLKVSPTGSDYKMYNNRQSLDFSPSISYKTNGYLMNTFFSNINLFVCQEQVIFKHQYNTIIKYKL